MAEAAQVAAMAADQVAKAEAALAAEIRAAAAKAAAPTMMIWTTISRFDVLAADLASRRTS